MDTENIKILFQNALEKLGISDNNLIVFETPKNPEFGDLSVNVAMKLSKQLKKKPLDIAQDIIDLIAIENSVIENLSIAAPGFINIKLKDIFYTDLLKKYYEYGEEICQTKRFESQKVNVEYVSVNPTGLLHLGHGRNACIGDTVANLYKANGAEVTREYYFNNAGNQMNNLAKSIFARYSQIIKGEDFPFPEDGYHGDYIKEIAQEIYTEHKEELLEQSDDNMLKFRKYGEVWCFGKIKKTLERMNIIQDIYFNEDSLYSDGKIQEVLNEFDAKGLTYKKDDALWMSFSKIGLKDDRVIVKSTGEPTYRLPDIAYHIEKFNRGYDILIDVFGADHIATVPDVLAAVSALGYEKDKVKVLIHQFVTLTENGQQIKMSKRTGKNYTLDDLLDEVGEDVVRFFLLMRGISTHLEFDLALAREQSDKNPVFYLQYAHARICSVIDNANSETKIDMNNIKFNLLTHSREIELIKEIIKCKKTLISAAEKAEPQILAEYLRDLASAFHAFYHDCRIIGVDEELKIARLAAAITAKNIIKHGLIILGISTPERM